MDSPLQAPQILSSEGIEMGPWRCGKRIVIATKYPGGNMPCRCMLCNAPVERLHEEMHAVPAPFRGKIISGIVYLLTVDRVALPYGLCSQHSTWTSPKTIAVMSGVVSGLLVLCGLGLLLGDFPDRFGLGCLIASFPVIIITIVATFLGRRVDAVSDDGFIWVSGFGKPFVQSLPEWRGKKLKL